LEGRRNIVKMRLSLAICFAIFGHLTIAAPFWKEEPCPLLNDEISKSFNEAKQNCSLADLKGSEKVLCQKLEENFKELCQSGKKGNAKLDIKKEDVCNYDIIKTESLVEACNESCQGENITLCTLLIQTHELLTPKLGENGGGRPPILLGSTQKNDSTSNVEEKLKQPVIPKETKETSVKVTNPPETTVSVPNSKVESNLPQSLENEEPKESKAKSNDSLVTSLTNKENPVGEAPQENKEDVKETNQQSVGIDNHMDEEALETQSQFFSYFVLLTILCIVGYIIYFNKKKILALLLEGRRKNSGGRSSRRGSSAQYRKLDNNLEEAMADNSEDTVRHVIY